MEKNQTFIVAINLTDAGSTGGVMIYSLEYARKNGFGVLAIAPKVTTKTTDVPIEPFGRRLSFASRLAYKIGRLIFRIPYSDGYFYRENTRRIIRIIKTKTKDYNKVIVCIHNIHHANIEFMPLIRFLARSGYEVVIVLHDTWLLGGGCYYSSHVGCQKWKDQCIDCPLGIPNSAKTLRQRTRALNKIKKLTWVPVSRWLEGELKRSRLRGAPTYVIPAETSVAPLAGENHVRDQLGIPASAKVILAVSAYWDDWKGAEYLYQVADLLPKGYILLVVGGSFDSKNRKNIIHVGNVERDSELPFYYQTADVFVSVTQAEALGLVLAEAQACGTPVVGFGHGGSAETVTEKSGIMVGTDNDVNKLVDAIVYVVEQKPFHREDIIASGNRFVKYNNSKKWLRLFQKLSG